MNAIADAMIHAEKTLSLLKEVMNIRIQKQNDDLKLYVLGFLFSEDKERVLLIEKNRPEWQKGLLNGIGGKIEIDEKPFEAMNRECEEECGLKNIYWEQYATLIGNDYKVFVFRAFNDFIYHAEQKESEEIEIEWVRGIDNLVPNCDFLIPLALSTNVQLPIDFNVK